MKYGQELIRQLEEEIQITEKAQANRSQRISNWETDEEDCFLSIRVEEICQRARRDKITLIENGGTAWFPEYATLDGQPVKARWCNTKYGRSLRAEMPTGEVVWTSSSSKKGLEKKGLKRILCKRPAWYCYKTPYTGMMGAYCGSYELFPSNINYATGEDAGVEPLEIRDAE